MTTTLRVLLLLAIALALNAPAAAQGPARPDAYNVLYGTADEGGRRLDVYLPPDVEPPYPVMLMFHGYGQNKSEANNLTLPEIAARAGFATVAANYSLSLSEAYADAWCALSWVQAHAADYQLDPTRVVTFGVSYGALPATMLAVQEQPETFALDCPHPAPDPEAVRGVVALAGGLLGTADALRAYEPEMEFWQNEATASLLESTPPEQWLALDLPAETLGYLALWPMTWIDQDEPPHLLIHGAGDSVVPYQSTYAYAEILSRNRTSVALVIDRLAGHVPAPTLFDYELEVFLGRAQAAEPHEVNMRFLFRIVSLLAFALALNAPAAAQGPARPDAYNVLYGAPEQGSRRLDVYLPPDAEPPYPVVLMFPGSDSRKQDMKDFGLIEIAIRGGAAAVAVAYDTSGPANAYADAWCALAWVQANAAEYHFDPAWIVTLGHSYGALPASMLAVQDDPALFAGDCPHPAADAAAIRGAVTIGGALLGSAEALNAYTADAPLWSDPVAADAVRATPPDDWLGLDLDAAALDFLGQWPMARIDDYEPPHLLIHGAEDYTVLPQSSFDYAQILGRHHTNVTLVMDRYSGHVPPPFAYDLELLTFLERAFAAR